MDRNRNALSCASGDVAHGITVTASVSIASTGDPDRVRRALQRAFESGRIRIPRSLARAIVSIDVLSDAADSQPDTHVFCAPDAACRYSRADDFSIDATGNIVTESTADRVRHTLARSVPIVP